VVDREKESVGSLEVKKDEGKSVSPGTQVRLVFRPIGEAGKGIR
jgi:uncharacterized OB-fold protein